MTQQTSPFLEGKYGWNYGESGWNVGMDENILKFSYLFDRNVDGIVSSLPAEVNGKAYFNTTDNRFYFVVNGSYYSSPAPRNIRFYDRVTGQEYIFDGISVVISPSTSSIDSRLDAVEITVSSLGTAANQNVEYFVKSSDLANGSDPTKNAALIGWKQRTLAARLNEVANVKDFGAIADGTLHLLSEIFPTLSAAQAVYPHVTALTESVDWAAWQAALNAGTSAVYAPAGWYVVNKGLIRNTNIKLYGDGYDSYLDFSPTTTGVAQLLIQGTLDQIGGLANNINKGDRSIPFAAPPALVHGEVVIAYNPTDFSWLNEAGRNSYRAGEMWRVYGVSGNDVAIYGNSTSTYVAASMQMYRMRGVKADISNMRFSPSDTLSYSPVRVLFGDGVRVKDIWDSNIPNYAGIMIERSFDVSVHAASSVNNSPAVDNEYGVVIANCHNFVVTGSTMGATRHALALAGVDAVCCVPNRNGLMYGLILENADIAADIGAGDMHGNADNLTYDNCIFRNGVILAGRNPTVRNSTIYGLSSTDGIAVYAAECVGGTYTIENNRIISRGIGASFGIIHITPSTSLSERMDLVVRDNTMELENATSSTIAVWLRCRGNTPNANADVAGLRVVRATALRAFLFVDDNTQVGISSAYLICDDVYGPSGAYLIYPVDDIASVPTRQMRQSGSVTITTTATTSVTAATQTFRYPYSKVPTYVGHGVSGVAGSVLDTLGGQIPITRIRQHTATTIVPAVSATAAFTAGATASLQWEAEIKEI